MPSGGFKFSSTRFEIEQLPQHTHLRVALTCLHVYGEVVKNYLSTGQVADHLGISRDALNAKIRAGDFAEPDVMIGDRFQGWSAETVELIRQQAEGNRILCAPDAASELVTTIRQAAEYVRAYGDSSTDPVSGIRQHVPAALHMIAARLENEVRRIVAWDHTAARSIIKLCDHDPAIYEVTPLPCTFGVVPIIIPPADTDDQTRSGQLRLAADLLGSVIMQMPEAMQSQPTRTAMAALGIQRDKIIEHADGLIGVALNTIPAE